MLVKRIERSMNTAIKAIDDLVDTWSDTKKDSITDQLDQLAKNTRKLAGNTYELLVIRGQQFLEEVGGKK